MPNAHIAIARSKILQQIRNFFTEQKFIEVETPILTPIPGMEPHLTPFETYLTIPSHISKTTTQQNIKNSKIIPGETSIPLYLNTSPELQMKKLLGSGFTNIFQLTKTFRNTEIGGPLHNPEFTMLEWYRTKADYKDLMRDCENLLISIIKNLKNTTSINFKTPWPRKSVNQLFIEHCKIDLLKNKTFTQFKKAAKKLNYDTNACKTWDDIFFKLFLNYSEPNLPKNRPIFIYDYPASQAALAKLNHKQPFFAERFELYINKIEIANAFSELTDAKEQQKRLKEEQLLRKKLKKTIFPIDEEFLASLESISYPCAGIALGVDRLIMLLLNKESIEETLLFPMIKMLKA